jgi:hypothetical protein
MNFASRLVLSGIFLVVFILGFSYYLTMHPWSPTDEMYPCLLVTGLIGLFLCTTPRSSH